MQSLLLGLPKVSVLILNYNGQKWLPNCLSSVARTEYENLGVYLIDNNSHDNSVEYVKKNFPTIKIIQFSRNLGFAEAYNRAIRQVEADYVALLNMDTEVLNPRWIGSLVQVASRDPRIAAVACKMVSMKDHSQLGSVGGMGIPFWRGFVDIGYRELDRGQFDKDFEPFAFCGGAALVKRNLFIRLKGFDERFFLYAEDVDLSWRLRLLGYRIGYAPDAKVAHHLSSSLENKIFTSKKLFYCHRNLLRAILKNCGSSLGWALRSYALYSLLIGAGFCIIEPSKSVEVMKAILWNLFNFSDAYAQRLGIQSGRTTGESEILARIYPKISRYRPAEHENLREILNTIFEYRRTHSPL